MNSDIFMIILFVSHDGGMYIKEVPSEAPFYINLFWQLTVIFFIITVYSSCGVGWLVFFGICAAA